jgi:hypothetical protein
LQAVEKGLAQVIRQIKACLKIFAKSIVLFSLYLSIWGLGCFKEPGSLAADAVHPQQ